MTFRDWIFSLHPENDGYNGQWQLPHILTLLISIAFIIGLTFAFRNKSRSARTTVLRVLAGCILFFEIARRIINYKKGVMFDLNSTLTHLLPRPWCAISCWILIFTSIFNKKTLWNFSAINALLCAIIFFAYPSTGFNHKHLLFENIYSIVTHALLIVSAVLILTYKLGDFRYKRETFAQGFLKEIIMFVAVFVYGILELPSILDLSFDPLFFVPTHPGYTNDVQEILGLSGALYLTLYFTFLIIWINAFYLIPILRKKLSKSNASNCEN
ncbi:MAG: YwaF family protein [Clostridia bacterium]|nr:YwaF family protein [Clostridia bacterium]